MSEEEEYGRQKRDFFFLFVDSKCRARRRQRRPRPKCHWKPQTTRAVLLPSFLLVYLPFKLTTTTTAGVVVVTVLEKRVVSVSSLGDRLLSTSHHRYIERKKEPREVFFFFLVAFFIPSWFHNQKEKDDQAGGRTLISYALFNIVSLFPSLKRSNRWWSGPSWVSRCVCLCVFLSNFQTEGENEPKRRRYVHFFLLGLNCNFFSFFFFS